MPLKEESIQKVVKFFETVLKNYRIEIDKRFFDYRFNFDMYFGGTIYIFGESKLIIKKSIHLDNIKIIKNFNPPITIDTHNSWIFPYSKLREIIEKDTYEYAIKIVDEEYQSEGYTMSQDYDKYLEKEWEKQQLWDLEDKKNIAIGHKKYLNSINKAIEETCENKYYEIDNIESIFWFFLNLKLPKNLPSTWYVSSTYIPSMIQMFLDLVSVGNYEATSLALRQIFESFLRALDNDVSGENIQKTLDWFKQSINGKKFSSRNKSGNWNACVIKNITDNAIFGKYPRNLRNNLSDMWSKLSFDVHKHKLSLRLVYKFDVEKFDLVYNDFLKITGLLLLELVLNFPETFDVVKYKLGADRENLEIFLLENVKNNK